MRKPSEIKIGEYTLKEILERHLHWLNKDCDCWENMKANLCNANLFNTDLRAANLSNADLRNTILRNADLCDAILYNSDLRDTNLYNANLSYADLGNTNLCDADLRNANLHNANLRSADLRNTDLCNANLHNADLRNANLHYADLRFANLYNADLRNAENIPYIPLACPSEGSFIAWKKVKDYLIKLEIPESAKRSSATTHKCRASEAKVLGIYTLDGKETDLKNILNTNQKSELDYVVEKTVYPDSFDENRWNECSHGIHFFINKQDAINY